MTVETIVRVVWTVRAIRPDDDSDSIVAAIESLAATSAGEAAGIVALLDALGALGPRLLPSKLCHHIEGPIWQLRKATHRMLWFYDEGRVVICTHMFVKRTQKTPVGEIRRALRSYQEYRVAKATGTLQIVDLRVS